MFLGWMVFSVICLVWKPHMIYHTLKWIIVMYLVPVVFIAVMVARRNSYIREDNLLTDNIVIPLGINIIIVYALAILWLVATIVTLIRCIIMILKKHSILRGNIPEDDPQAAIVFEEVKEALNMKCKVTLERNDLQLSPITFGIRNKYVVLPYEHYEPEELRIIFMHELLHIKKHDLVYKLLAVIAMAIQSFNPFVYLLERMISFWSEQDCDARVLEYMEPEGLTSNHYFDLIFRFSDKDEHVRRSAFIFSMLIGRKYDFERRVTFMKKFGKNRKRASRFVTAAIAMAFILISTISAYAAGVKLADVNDELYKKNMEVDTVSGVINDEAGVQFIVKPADDPGVEIVEVQDMLNQCGMDNFDWTIKVGTRFTTTLKWMSKGTEVTVSVTVDPTDCTFWYGLMDPNDNCSVREAKRGGSATFTTTSTGFHRIMVENRSKKEIRAMGSYNY